MELHLRPRSFASFVLVMQLCCDWIRIELLSCCFCCCCCRRWCSSNPTNLSLSLFISLYLSSLSSLTSLKVELSPTTPSHSSDEHFGSVSQERSKRGSLFRFLLNRPHIAVLLCCIPNTRGRRAKSTNLPAPFFQVAHRPMHRYTAPID